MVGIDSRIIQSVESSLKRVAEEEAGASIDDSHPSSLRSVGWLRHRPGQEWSYSGFTAEDEPDYIQDLAKALAKEAKKWHILPQIGRGSWPRR